MDPITREEKLMAGEQLEPITRKEMFLAKAAGMDIKTPEPITREEMFLSMISGGGTGGSGGGGSIPSVSPKAVNFYDYDGTCLYAYTVEEAQALTETPPLPEREGLICQGWNWTLEDIKAHNRSVNVGATYITDDGTTRIYITLQEGRTSPMLGVCPNGTVTVDWGDGTAPDVLTGTSLYAVRYTPKHEYAKPGDYVIRLTADNGFGICGNGNRGSFLLRDDAHNANTTNAYYIYSLAVKKIELGANAYLYEYSFWNMYNLKTILLSNGITRIGPDTFENCRSLEFCSIPNSITTLRRSLFAGSGLKNVSISSSVTTMEQYVFHHCYFMKTVIIPDKIEKIPSYSFSCGYVFIHFFISAKVNTIDGSAFDGCYNALLYDFSSHTAVPTLSNTSAFSGIPSDCEIRVPAALYDEWIAATNWATYASQIVAV